MKLTYNGQEKNLLSLPYLIPIKYQKYITTVSLRKWGPIDHHSDYAVAVDHLLQTDTKEKYREPRVEKKGSAT